MPPEIFDVNENLIRTCIQICPPNSKNRATG